MSYIDIIIMVPLVIAGIRGFRKGFISELAGLLALVVGVLGAMHLSYFLADIAVSQGWAEANNRVLGPLCFLIAFLAIVFCLNMVGNLVTSLLNIVALGLVNRLAGVVFALAKMLLMLSIALIAIDSFGKDGPVIPEEVSEGSLLMPPMREAATTLMPAIKEMIMWDSLPKNLDEIEQIIDESSKPAIK